ncbi:MAG: type II toxin-antitoxin system HicB family antitoxin [Pseudomonadota bacterium]
MDRYVALVHHDPKKGAYGIMFPDFPGCVSAAATFDGVIASGTEALAYHVDLMREDRDPIPKPRDLAGIKAAREEWIEWEDAIVTTIPLVTVEGKAVRINITLDKGLVKEIDAACDNRSGFLAEAAMGRLASGAGRRAQGASFKLGRGAAGGMFTTVKHAREIPRGHVVGRMPKKGYGDTKKDK